MNNITKMYSSVKNTNGIDVNQIDCYNNQITIVITDVMSPVTF